MELTDTRTDGVDLEAALAATYAHHGRLVADRRRRVRLVTGAAALLLVAGGVIAGLSLRDDSSSVDFAGVGDRPASTVPASADQATSPDAPIGPAVPDGFSFEQRPDGVFVLQRIETPPLSSPNVQVGEATLAGGGATADRAATVASHYQSPEGWVTVKFACVAGPIDRIDRVLYRLDGSTLTVDAEINSLHGDQPCTDLDGAVTPLPGIAVTAPVEVIAGPLG